MDMNSVQNNFLNFIGGNTTGYTNAGQSGLGKQSVGPTNFSNPVGNVWLGGDQTSQSIADLENPGMEMDDTVQLSDNAQMMITERPGNDTYTLFPAFPKYNKSYEFTPTEKNTERFLVSEGANYSDEQIMDKMYDYYLDKLGINSQKVDPSERESILRQHGIVIQQDWDLSCLKEDPYVWVEDEPVGHIDGFQVFYDPSLDIYNKEAKSSSDPITIGSWEKKAVETEEWVYFDKDGKKIVMGGEPEHTHVGGDYYIEKMPWKDYPTYYPTFKPIIGGLTPPEPGPTPAPNPGEGVDYPIGPTFNPDNGGLIPIDDIKPNPGVTEPTSPAVDPNMKELLDTMKMILAFMRQWSQIKFTI